MKKMRGLHKFTSEKGKQENVKEWNKADKGKQIVTKNLNNLRY